MEHEVNARFVENIVNEYNNYFFSVKNGLQITSKNFKEIERINLLEFFDSDEKLFIIGKGRESDKDKGVKKVPKFIIWDLHDTGEYIELNEFPITETNIKDIYTRLAITSGNVLRIENNGKVSSVLKKVEIEIKKKKLNKVDKVPDLNVFGIGPNGKEDKNHTIYYDKKTNFKQIVNDREPWLPGGYERTSYCHYHDKKGKETETLQLIVGRLTVQIWHQINDDSKNKDELPNKGEAFLDYIWSNRIPVKQEENQTRLRIEKFVYRSNDGSNSKIEDFYLKVYWYERKDDKENTNEEGDAKKKKHEITKEEAKEIDEIEENLKEIDDDSDISEMKKEKRKQNIISEKVKRQEKVIQGKDIEKFHTVRHACKAFEHIRKRYKSKSDADNYKYERHVPSNKTWPGKRLLKDDDFDFDKREDELPDNNMELAIYYCRGLKDTIIVAYLLEYYSRNPTNCVGWLCTVSAIPLLFKYNYDDFARKLLDQDHLLSQDPDENILIESYNCDTKFRALTLYIKKQKKKHTFSEILKRFSSILIPQPRQIKQSETNKLSPFSKMILYENNDDIYDNPAIEAVIDFHWWKTKFFLFILLRDPKNTEIRESTYSGVAKDPSTNGTLYYINLKPDPKSSNDNPFSTYYTAIEATYFWMSGNWIQRDKFDNWAVGAFTLIATGTKGKRKLLRYQANYIATFEAFHVRFSDSELEYEPKHTYYSNFEETSNIMMNIFRERNYDNHSLLTYNNNIKKIIENYINLIKDINHDLKDLIERVKDKNSIEEIEKIGNTKNDMNYALDENKRSGSERVAYEFRTKRTSAIDIDNKIFHIFPISCSKCLLMDFALLKDE
ncbi:hypothetical protein C1646_753647 [Rhizophagus diaphanus]|nr:hypothetical protein C1646_753647 [Rhizophagus diaphanus] [Rhizophagus sp. MUCL 43196]